MVFTSLAAALNAAIEGAGTARVTREFLENAAVASDSSMGFSHDRRERLHAAILELVDAQVITLPQSKQSFELRPGPPLPKWVRCKSAPARQQTVAITRLWRTELADAAALARNAADRALLETVNEFLREGGSSRPMVPSRERSLQLFGDEKRLDGLRRHRFFTSGILNFDLLRCFDVPLPFPSVFLTDGQPDVVTAPLLVLENHHTYVSMLEAARRAVADGHRPFHVGWGSGNAFPQSVASARLLVPQVDQIWYFGDLDEGGLVTASAVTAKMSGSSWPVSPALRLYALLLAHGIPRSSNPLDADRAHRLSSWLGPELAPRAEELLIEGIALRQEAVGTELLLEHGFPELPETT